MLRNKSKLAKDAVSKSTIIFKVFLRKFLEFFLYHQIFGLKTMFLLILLLNYCFIEKQNGKKDLICSIGLDSFKIIFVLLVKTIAI